MADDERRYETQEELVTQQILAWRAGCIANGVYTSFRASEADGNNLRDNQRK